MGQQNKMEVTLFSVWIIFCFLFKVHTDTVHAVQFTLLNRTSTWLLLGQ